MLRPSDGKTREVTWTRLPFAGGSDRWRIEVPGVQAELIERGEDGRVHVLTHWDYQKGHRIEDDREAARVVTWGCPQGYVAPASLSVEPAVDFVLPRPA